jgi:hypothetical protein
MSTSFFGGAFFNGEFFDSGSGPTPPPEVIKTGGKGDNEKGKKKVIFKPTGLTYSDKPKKHTEETEVRKSIDERIAESEELLAAIKQVSEEATRTEAVQYKPIEKMALSEIDAEIRDLMKKANRKREDEELIMILMAISQVS